MSRAASNKSLIEPISGYPNYGVSQCGKVINLQTRRIHTIHNDTKGYPLAFLYNNGARRTRKIHRLVAEAFIPNPKNYPQVNHKDGNKENNHYTNLEWCTNEQNLQHKLEFNLQSRGINHASAKLTEVQVKKIRQQCDTHTITALAQKYQVDRKTIRAIRDRLTWRHINEEN